jgi:hypothetical protein
MVLCAERFGDPLSAGGRPFTDVYGDVEDGSLSDADEFALRVFDLVVEAAENAFGASAVIVLDEVDGCTDG